MITLSAPVPYFGSKRVAAPLIWRALGHDVPNFVDPCCGSAAVLWARPAAGKVETVNDAWGAIPNFLRALKHHPEETAEHASWPVSELDMHARHRWLVERMDEAFVERLRADPEWCNPEVAGWWCWGQSIWIGSGWCQGRGDKRIPHLGGAAGPTSGQDHGRGVFRSRLPHLAGPNNLGKQIPALTGPGDGSGVGYGRGIFSSARQLPHLAGQGQGDLAGPHYGKGVVKAAVRDDLVGYFRLLAARLARVRITCGDWTRVVTPAVTTSHGLTGILLDPPYGEAAQRSAKLYAHDDSDTAPAMRAWCAEHGGNPHLRIVLCGYAGEHETLQELGWRCVPWKARGGYGNQDGENANAARERLWLSPHCLGEGASVGPLFGGAA